MRDLLRRPGESLLISAALTLLVAVSATSLLLTQSLGETAREMLSGAPAMVVRKIGPGGWEPIPEKEAVACAEKVPGITGVRTRTWGLVIAAKIPITVVAADGPAIASLSPYAAMIRLPGKNEAVTGPGIDGIIGEYLNLSGGETINPAVIGALGADTAMAIQDVVLLHPDDARRVLGIPDGYASDLALDVFHDEEAHVLIPELSAAFPWPVKIATRDETAGFYAAGYSRQGGIALIGLTPAIFALCLIVFHTVRERTGRRREVGLLKAIGWTTGDIVTLQLFRAAWAGIPAAVSGVAIAYALVFMPGITWPASFFFGWNDRPPGLYLQADGALISLLLVVAIVMAPFFAATLWPALKSAAADPQDIMGG